MEYILQKDYDPFKKGQVIRLGEQTADKLIASGVVIPKVKIPPKPRPEIKTTIPKQRKKGRK